MLQSDLRKMAGESLFNPRNTTLENKILLQVGNPGYWTTKAVELIMATNTLSVGSVAYQNSLKEAIKLLLITRVETSNGKLTKPKKTRNTTPKSDNKTSKDS